MSEVLVVDDSPMDRKFAGRFLLAAGIDVAEAKNGIEALDRLEQSQPAVVLTDLQMPEMDGLQLVREIRDRFPAIPVVLMTAFGSEEVAVQALQSGASSYVSKENLGRDVVKTVQAMIAVSQSLRETAAALDSITSLEAVYTLDNRLEKLEGLISHIKQQMRQMRLFGNIEELRIGTALHEALANSVEHGNLELDSELRVRSDYRQIVDARNAESPYRDRAIQLTVRLTRRAATFVVRDEGPGFDPDSLPDPTLPENVGKTNGRGLFLIRTFMDKVSFNRSGNEITMVKQHASTR